MKFGFQSAIFEAWRRTEIDVKNLILCTCNFSNKKGIKKFGNYIILNLKIKKI